MRIFVNDKPLDIVSHKKLDPTKNYVKGKPIEQYTPESVDLKNHLLFEEPGEDEIIRILYALRTGRLKKLKSVTIVSSQKREKINFVKSRFQIIKAAGGVVQDEKGFLLIHRFGKWDFPKGKFEKGESPKDCAVREVEEECAISAKAFDRICKTWHTYTKDRKSILKLTYWYDMICISDEGMKPQKEEGIDDIKWMSKKEVKVALKDSYPSMRYLFKKVIGEEY
ncbi:NUDIX hydrolase [Algoriphagus sediminis]|uniref:NUDIX domain-containing protein n=1 Tax=Algoriphagus sediminis TaxID=3057113 RepID=A0ABT7Y7S6_9BACT|nr:NUDIX domain-containing protein [Algoriphagus sediminis]MDN3202528.1 NUDIX domain-containing protein [Algoriphagus sediminis]